MLDLVQHPPADDPDQVRLPQSLVWDYREPPRDLLWRLQRVASWFPAYGRDRRTVRLLFEHRAELSIPVEVRTLIELYEEAWQERAGGHGTR
jgi:hypothetical protein